jgi:uncharacterized protein (DUF2225 family)
MTIDVAEVKRRLLALLNDQNLVNDYIRQFGPTIDIKHIKEIKETKAKSLKRREDEGIGEDPIFDIMVKCPVCNQDNVASHELKAKSQQITQTKFLVPLYEGAGGFKSVDYAIMAVTVCPRCLFASPDKKDFSRHNPSNHSEIKSQLASNIILALQEKIGERKVILKSITDYTSYFKRPRSDDAAIDSYKLSISRAKVEAWFEQPYSYYKLGSYSLRIARLQKELKAENKETYREALNYFEESFRTSNTPNEDLEMQTIYLITALYLKLEDQKKANSYIGVFNNLHNARVGEMRDNPKLTLVNIDKWGGKAKTLWEDRDDPEIFKND